MADDITAANWHLPRFDEAGRDLRYGLPVRFVGGKHNGWHGQLIKLCDSWCSIRVVYDNKPIEVVEEYRFLLPVSLWKAGKTEAELSLRDT